MINTEPQQSTLTKRERKRLERIKLLAAQPGAEATAHAIDMAVAVAHRKMLEVEKGCKVTKKERAAMVRAMTAGIQAAADVGMRIKAFQEVPEAMLMKAKQQESTLINELAAAASRNASGARAVAERVSPAAEQAVSDALFDSYMQASQAIQGGDYVAPSAVAVEQGDAEKLAAAVHHAQAATDSAHAVGETTAVEETSTASDTSTPSARTVEQPSACVVETPATAVTAAQDCALSTAQVEEEEKRGRGRPSTYTPEQAVEICNWIQSGNSLNSYLKIHGGNAATIYGWMRDHADFARNYAGAHVDRADTIVEDMLDIADKLEDATDIVQVMAGKVRIETRKWIAERMRPDKYGNKISVDHRQPVTFNLGIPRRQQEVIDITPATPQLHNDKSKS